MRVVVVVSSRFWEEIRDDTVFIRPTKGREKRNRAEKKESVSSKSSSKLSGRRETFDSILDHTIKRETKTKSAGRKEKKKNANDRYYYSRRAVLAS